MAGRRCSTAASDYAPTEAGKKEKGVHRCFLPTCEASAVVWKVREVAERWVHGGAAALVLQGGEARGAAA